MPILAMSAGRVTAIWGKAYVRQPDGALKALQVGDVVPGGTRVITEADGMVEISPVKPAAVTVAPPDGDAEMAAASPERSGAGTSANVGKGSQGQSATDQAIAALESLDPGKAPGAGPATGDGEGGLQPGLRVARVSEAQASADIHAFSAAADAGEGAFGSSADQRPLADANGTGRPLIAIDNIQVNEGAGFAVFTVTLDRPSDAVVTVGYKTIDFSAVSGAGGDYTAMSGVLRFQPGETVRTIAVPVLNDKPGVLESAGAIGEDGRQRFAVLLTDATQAAIDEGRSLGVGVIRDDGQGSLPTGLVPDDDRPKVGSVEVLAADADYVYFGIRLTHASESPIQLKLDVSPGNHEGLEEDAWTGAMSYSLDAAEGSGEDIAFLPIMTMPSADLSHNLGVITIQPLTPPGLIIVKVPVFATDDGKLVDGELVRDPLHLDNVTLQASTQYDAQAKSAGTGLLHGLIGVEGSRVEEGQMAMFKLTLATALERDIAVKLTLASGEDDPATSDNERALVGADTGGQLAWLSPDGHWVPIGEDGVLHIRKGEQLVHIGVRTVDDGIPEGTESFLLHVTGAPGDVVPTSGSTGLASILPSDGDIDPINLGEGALDLRDVLSDASALHGGLDELLAHALPDASIAGPARPLAADQGEREWLMPTGLALHVLLPSAQTQPPIEHA